MVMRELTIPCTDRSTVLSSLQEPWEEVVRLVVRSLTSWEALILSKERWDSREKE